MTGTFLHFVLLILQVMSLIENQFSSKMQGRKAVNNFTLPLGSWKCTVYSAATCDSYFCLNNRVLLSKALSCYRLPEEM